MKFPLDAYPGMNRFVLAWLSGSESATRFLPRAGDVAPRAAKRAATPEMIDALAASNRRWGSDVGDELRRWAGGESVAIIAGQQAGFAGGPIYTLAKIASLVALKRRLARTGIDATIFFWVATEDHDFAEAATLHLPVASIAPAKTHVNRQSDLMTLRATRRVDSRQVVGPSPVPETLIQQLLGLYDLPRPSYFREGISFGDSFAELCALAFDEKIVFVDALLPELRRAGAPLFERIAARRDEIESALETRAAVLRAARWTPQVESRPGEPYTLLFRVGTNGERTILQDGVADHPESISTSALTRPLLQDFVFGPAIFVGGPSEVSYYAQIAPLHQLLGIEMPRVALRGHALLTSTRVMATIERLGIAAPELFSTAEAIIGARESDDVARVKSIAARARKHLARDMAEIGEIALPAEHSIARALNRSIGHIEYHFDKLAERALRGLVRKEQERFQAVARMLATLHPDGHVQDRVAGWFPFWLKSGSALIERLIDGIEPDSASFEVIAT